MGLIRLFTRIIVIFVIVYSCQKDHQLNNSNTGLFIGYCDDKTKTSIDNNLNTFWTDGDAISVFRSPVNEKFNFIGTENNPESIFIKDNSTEQPSVLFKRNYSVYPYNINNQCDSEGEIHSSIPNYQYYAVNSFAPNISVMAAVTESINDNRLRFRNVCGYIRINIYGGDPISKIILNGNNHEKIAGEGVIYLDGNYPPQLVMSETANESIVLDCGDIGVNTGKVEEEQVSFIFTLAPVVFTQGITITIINSSGKSQTFKSSRSFEVKRNTIKTMASINFSLSGGTSFTNFCLKDQKGNVYDAYVVGGKDITVRIPYDNENPGSNLSSLIAVFAHNGHKVLVGDAEQISGETVNDFSDFINGVTYKVVASNGDIESYTVKAIDANLPMLFITTPDFYPVTTKEWLPQTNGSEIFIVNTDGSKTDLGKTGIKGRGNSTWGQPKNPYNIKLESKVELLGMKKSKKWCLMANYFDPILMRNTIAMEMANRMDHLGWNPHGEYVEFVLNGKWMGNYWVCEKIEVDKNRINISELLPTDNSGDSMTGGYIFEYDAHGGEAFSFVSEYFSMPVNFKDPDEDISSVQFNYVKDYINSLEAILKDPVRLQNGEYESYINTDSFIDWWIITNISCNGWETTHPFSVYFHKDRGGKLNAGPMWDFDLASFSASENLDVLTTLYYGALFQNSSFVNRLKEKWNIEKNYILGDDAHLPIVDYITNIDDKIKYSAHRDKAMWGDVDNRDYDWYVNWAKSSIPRRIRNMDTEISKL